MKKYLILFLMILMLLFSSNVLACDKDDNPTSGTATFFNTASPVNTVQNNNNPTNTFNPTNNNSNTNTFSPDNKNTNTFAPDNKNTNTNNNSLSLDNKNTNTNSNKNDNTNLNTNLNTNKIDNKVDVNVDNNLDQKQKQNQKQMQSQGQFQQNTLVFAPVDQREFPNPGSVNYPSLITMQAPPDKGFAYQPANEFLQLQDTFNEEQLNAMSKMGFWDKSPIIKAFKILDLGKEVSMVRFVTKADMLHSKVVGYVYAQHKSKVGVTIQLYGKVGKEAIKMGGNTVLVLADGAARSQYSASFGLGSFFTIANQGDTEDTGRIGGGGSGFNRGFVETKDKPWVRFVILSVDN
jgi:hypothetical protein